jgi:hypothetical protein
MPFASLAKGLFAAERGARVARDFHAGRLLFEDRLVPGPLHDRSFQGLHWFTNAGAAAVFHLMGPTPARPGHNPAMAVATSSGRYGCSRFLRARANAIAEIEVPGRGALQCARLLYRVERTRTKKAPRRSHEQRRDYFALGLRGVSGVGARSTFWPT